MKNNMTSAMRTTRAVRNSSSPGALGIGRAVKALTVAWTIAMVLGALVALFLPSASVVAGLILALGTAFALYGILELVLARGRVLRNQEVPVWKGLARIISWNPTEGVVFLRNKEIDFVDDDVNDGGGIRAIYPLLGEELVLRVPLEIQTLKYRDEKVLTKEYMPLTVQGTIYWRVMDLNRFYLQISKELHFANDTGGHTVDVPSQRPQFEVAEQWLRSMAEEKTRTIVSCIGTGLLIADQLATDLPKALSGTATLLGPSPESSGGYRSATEGLAETIQTTFQTSVRDYGLEIHRVALQEVSLPPEIYGAAVEACKSAYLPLRARAEALERKMKLQAEADVIGADAVGLREIAGSIPALAFQDFLAPLFLNFNRQRNTGTQSGQMAAPPV